MTTANGTALTVADATLAKLTEGCRLLAEVRTVGEALQLHDQAATWQYWLRQQGAGLEAQNHGAELKLRAERRLGELIPETVHPGNPQFSHDGRNGKLPDGVSWNQSSRWQSIARLDAPVFEAHLAETRKAGKEITTAGVLTLARTQSRNDRKREDLWSPPPQPDANPLPADVLTGDCLDLLPLLKECPRLIFADPPYNVGVDYGDGAAADRLPDDAYLKWVAEWVGICGDVLADDGSLWVLIGDEYAAEYALILKAAGFHRRAWIKWYETFGVCNSAGTNFSRTSRHLFYCGKDRQSHVWNREAVSRLSDRETKYDDPRANPEGKVWDDVWMIPRLAGAHAERLPDFPTQLPLALLRPIIGCASHPGDLVVDPFSGSATSGVAALELGRRYLGTERNDTFATLSRQRLLRANHATG